MSTVINLDLAGLKSEDEFHDRASKAFGFPHYYGRNPNAFWDCITESVGETRVQIFHFDTLTPIERDVVKEYLSMLNEYADQSGGEFVVVCM